MASLYVRDMVGSWLASLPGLQLSFIDTMRLFASTWTTIGFQLRASTSSFASANVAMITRSPGLARWAAAPLTQMTPDPAGASSA